MAHLYLIKMGMPLLTNLTLNLVLMDLIMAFKTNFIKIFFYTTISTLFLSCKERQEYDEGQYHVVKYYAYEYSQESTVMKKNAKWINNKPVLATGMIYHKLTEKELKFTENLSYNFIIKNIMTPHKDYYRVDKRFFRQFLGYEKDGKLFAIGNFYPFTITKYPKDGCLCCIKDDDTRHIFNPYMKNTKDDSYVLLRINLTDKIVNWY